MRSLTVTAGVFAVAAGLLLAGAILAWTGRFHVAHLLWALGALSVLGFVLYDVACSLIRREAGIDVLAAVAIVGAILLGEYLSAIAIAVMFASGRALESFAQARAGREMSALLARAPRNAYRMQSDALICIGLDEVRIGDRLLVRAGDAVPVDGLVQSSSATLDESVLTGESVPVERHLGDVLRSGAVNAGAPFEMLATETAQRSTFAGIARLVESARTSRAPATRLADRYALWFVPISLGLAGIAWLVSDSPVRALAVLVVATPCPLILAVPVALVSGMSNCARRGILIKGGAALEGLARAKALFFDKTGTLTGGQARLVQIQADAQVDKAQVLRTAASLDQVSAHITASAIVSAARERGLQLSLPIEVNEEPGAGLAGMVEGASVRVGTPDFVCRSLPTPGWSAAFLATVGSEGGSAVFVARDGKVIGALHLADQIRVETSRALRMLRQVGIERMVMLTGDRRDVATAIGAAVGVDEIRAELDPAGKLAALGEVPAGVISIMVGDGINDAPALAAAGVGVAMGARGAAASSEAADVVLLVDRLDRLAEAVYLAKASRRIAMQSVALGMGMSLIAMAVAAAGYLAPVYGAALQEIIDVIAIANSLRALHVAPLRVSRRRLPAEQSLRLRAEHEELLPLLDHLSSLADQVLAMPAEQSVPALRQFDQMLAHKLVPHEVADDARVYPMVAGLLGGDDPMASLSRTHREIFTLARRLHGIVQALAPASVDEAAMREVQRILYGLDAILRLHFAQEEELYLALS
ncbi:MAG TPA: heavy metal translocating P-type ATPase [Bordetella sp.]|uniref:heavy metal translocating P-type ATPase n=1 Tax=Bordetella sp. TaxID=28081 RepID=UPI002ED279A4